MQESKEKMEWLKRTYNSIINFLVSESWMILLSLFVAICEGLEGRFTSSTGWILGAGVWWLYKMEKEDNGRLNELLKRSLSLCKKRGEELFEAEKRIEELERKERFVKDEGHRG